MIRLNPNERLLIERGLNHFKILGPGRVWLKPWERALTRLYVGPQEKSLQFSAVRTVEAIPVEVTLQALYRIDPELFTPDLMPMLPRLNEGRWQHLLQWRTEAVLRPLLAAYAWPDLDRDVIQQRLERRLRHTLAETLQPIGLNVRSICLLKTGLPAGLQHTLVEAEQNGVMARGRARVLKEYFDIFGSDLAEAMPHIVQWELLNLMRNKGQLQFLVTGSASVLNGQLAGSGSAQPAFQMQLPLPFKEDQLLRDEKTSRVD